jgi:hypothetical protein
MTQTSQDYVLGHSQSSLRDSARNQALTQTLKPRRQIEEKTGERSAVSKSL